MKNDNFVDILNENKTVADQLFLDLEKQFRLMRRVWKSMNQQSLADQLDLARQKIEGIEILIGIVRTKKAK